MLKLKTWSPYLVGSGIGILSWVTILFMKKTLGSSAAFMRIGTLLHKLLIPSATVQTIPILINWQFVLIVFAFVGAKVAASLSSYKPPTVPELWKLNFGQLVRHRYIGAFIGGSLLMLGARIAGGCTTGHAISGGLQLSVAGWLFMTVFFISGIITAFILYPKR